MDLISEIKDVPIFENSVRRVLDFHVYAFVAKLTFRHFIYLTDFRFNVGSNFKFISEPFIEILKKKKSKEFNSVPTNHVKSYQSKNLKNLILYTKKNKIG